MHATRQRATYRLTFPTSSTHTGRLTASPWILCTTAT